jgi:hypothetical protein
LAPERFYGFHPDDERREGRDGPVHLAGDFATPDFRGCASSFGGEARRLGSLSLELLLLPDDLGRGATLLGVTFHVPVLPFQARQPPAYLLRVGGDVRD